jgi:predicted anti-sigma-YlaC factor YlaD
MDDELRCRLVIEALTEYLEEALLPEARLRVEAHLMTCDSCTTFLDQLKDTIRVTGSLAAEEKPSPHLRQALLELYREAHSPTGHQPNDE